MRSALVTLSVLLVAPPAFAQSEAALKEFFEGTRVVVKLDMPATQTGIDVYADARRPMDFEEYSNRLKAVGVSIRSGDAVMITKIKVKDKIVEFQLAGGGYGTVGDDTDSSVYVPGAPKSNREKSLEREVKSEPDATRRRRLEHELDDLRRERQREDQRNKAISAAATEEKKRRIAEQRLHAGSRFNIRYQGAVPAGLTPGGVMAALADFVDFPSTLAGAPRPSGHGPVPVRPSAATPAPLQKGMTLPQVAEIYGDPEKSTDRMEGKLKVTTATFTRADHRLEAEFVEGVLIRYSLSSK
jgi:hypothetical protein